MAGRVGIVKDGRRQAHAVQPLRCSASRRDHHGYVVANFVWVVVVRAFPLVIAKSGMCASKAGTMRTVGQNQKR